MTTALVWGTGYVLFSFAVLCLVVWWGGRELDRAAARTPAAGPWPKAALIVPVTGAPECLADCLASLANQDYPDCRVFFVVRDEADPAVPVIGETVRGREKVRMVMAGPARTCSQKNHNLLAGAAAADRSAEILVFADSTHAAHPEWLKELVGPMTAGPARIVSGFHQVDGFGPGPWSLGRAVITLVLHLLRAIPWFRQPWGGATAIDRRLFEELGTAEFWSRTVVDDVTLDRLLKKGGHRTALPGGPPLSTRFPDLSFGQASDWMTRQWSYLKFLQKPGWATLGTVGTAFTLALVFPVILLSLTCLGQAPAWAGALSVVSGLAGLVFCHSLRRRFAVQVPAVRWIIGCLAGLAILAWSQIRTWPADGLTWAGYRYKVDPGGRVTGIEHIGSQKGDFR